MPTANMKRNMKRYMGIFQFDGDCSSLYCWLHCVARGLATLKPGIMQSIASRLEIVGWN